MMKKLILAALLFCGVGAYGQAYQQNGTFGIQFKRLATDSGFNLPKGDTSLNNSLNRGGAIIYKSSNQKLYFHNGSYWVPVTSGAVATLNFANADLTFDNERIHNVNGWDLTVQNSLAAKGGYFKLFSGGAGIYGAKNSSNLFTGLQANATQTLSLMTNDNDRLTIGSNGRVQFNNYNLGDSVLTADGSGNLVGVLRVKYSDTSAMLSPYLIKNNAAAIYQPIGSYLVGADTSSINTRLNNKLNIWDSTIYSTKANYKKGVDSLSSVFNTSLGNYLPLTGGTLTGALTGTSATFSGNVGIGNTSPTALLHLKAGTASANTAPLKFTAGTNLTTPEAGAMEWDGTSLFITQSSSTRKTLAYTSDITAGYVPYTGANANIDINTRNFTTTGTITSGLINGQTISSAANFTGTLNVNGLIYGNSKEIINTGDSYLRFNQSGAFSNGIWIDNSNLQGGSGTFALGSNGTPTTARVIINGGTYNGANVITLDGSNGNITAVSFIKSGGLSSQFLKADGSVDGSTYLTSAVTSVATGNGLSGGTITTSGTLTADTSILSTKNYRQKGVDSLSSAFNTSLGNYLPLTGGTLTGALTGTSATFSGSIETQSGGYESGKSKFYYSAALGTIILGNSNASDYVATITSGIGSKVITVKQGTQDVLLVQEGGGNVGIGTTSPGYKLDVNGTGNFTGALTGTSAFFSGALAQKYSSDTKYSGWIGNANGEYSLYTASATTSLTGGEQSMMVETASGGDMFIYKNLTLSQSLTVTGAINTSSTIKTAQPSANGAGVWKLGKYKVAAASLNADAYIEVDIDGTIYKLLIGN